MNAAALFYMLPEVILFYREEAALRPINRLHQAVLHCCEVPELGIYLQASHVSLSLVPSIQPFTAFTRLAHHGTS